MESSKPSHRKLKNDIMVKFFNEPVDALDLRLTKAEAALSLADPWEEKDTKDCDESSFVDEGPLDFSDVRPADSPGERPSSDISEEYWDDAEDHNDESADKYPDLSSDVQFITARALKSFRNHPYNSQSRPLYPSRLHSLHSHQGQLPRPPSSVLVNKTSNIDDNKVGAKEIILASKKPSILQNWCHPSQYVPKEKTYPVKKEVCSQHTMEQKINSIENYSQYSENPLLRYLHDNPFD